MRLFNETRWLAAIERNVFSLKHVGMSDVTDAGRTTKNWTNFPNSESSLSHKLAQRDFEHEDGNSTTNQADEVRNQEGS